MRTKRAHDKYHLKAGTHPGFPEWMLLMNVEARFVERCISLALRDVGGDMDRVKVVETAFWDSCPTPDKGKVSIWIKKEE